MADNEKPKLNKRTIIGASIAAAVVVVLLVVSMVSSGDKADPRSLRATFTVEPRDLTVSVTESGEIKARQYTDYLCEVEGSTAITDIVEEGTEITAEDVANNRVLVQLDSSELQESYTQQKITFATAEAAYTEAQEANDIQVNQNESDITTSELAVKFALMDLKKFLSETLADELVAETAKSQRPDDVIIADLIAQLREDPNDPRWGGAALQNKRLLESSIKLAKGQLEKDKNQLRGTKKLFEKQYVAASELERDQLSYDGSVIEVQQAETELDLFLKYDFAKQTEQLYSDYVEAGRQLERTVASARAKLAQTWAKLNEAKATYDLQQERLLKLERQLKACTILATVPGMAIYGTSTDYYARREDPIEIGDSVREGQKIITIPNTDEMAAELRVHESWVQRVRPGLEVRITPDPFPDMELTGKVVSVAPLPDPQSRWMSTGLKVYSTRVSIDGTHPNLRPGMSAKVEIIIEELQDVLCVPVQAVASRKGTKYCYVVTGSGLEQRIVKTGSFNETFIEVKEGLADGDVISLVPPIDRDQQQSENGNGRRRKGGQGQAGGPGQGQKPQGQGERPQGQGGAGGQGSGPGASPGGENRQPGGTGGTRPQGSRPGGNPTGGGGGSGSRPAGQGAPARTN